MHKVTPVKTVDRLVRVLDCFSTEKEAWSLTEISQHLDLHKSTLHRFLKSLEAHDILRREAGDPKWRLGYRLFLWGSRAVDNTGLLQLAQPVVHQLMNTTGETALLTIYSEQEVVCIAKAESRYPVRMTMDIGRRRLPHAGASSKALMAFLPPDEIQRIIQQSGLPKLFEQTITRENDLLDELEHIRQQGYATSYEETDPGAWGIAAPIFNQYDLVAAAIGIAGPKSRLDKQTETEFISQCLWAAAKLTSMLRTGIKSSDEDSESHSNVK